MRVYWLGHDAKALTGAFRSMAAAAGMASVTVKIAPTPG